MVGNLKMLVYVLDIHSIIHMHIYIYICIHNFRYIETIFHVLKPGGFWLNLGPLLYHWVADIDNNQDERYKESIEVGIWYMAYGVCIFNMSDALYAVYIA